MAYPEKTEGILHDDDLFDPKEKDNDEDFLSEEDLDEETLSEEDHPPHEHFRFTADRNQTLLRIDKFLIDRLTNISRNRIQSAAEANCILVNGKAVKSNYRVKPMDVITIMMSRPRYESEVIPENIPLHIVYEDDELLVVNKPAGLVVHPGHGNYRGTLVNGLAYYLKDDPLYDPDDPCVGLVHRIDKDTSGLLVVAKRPETKTNLSLQFFNKTTQRKYTALVWGIPKEAEGRIEGNIGRDPRDRMVMAVFPDGEQGKPAVTHYRVLEKLGYVSLIECRLETGRTHQIRTHMKHIGHPIFNDGRYGGDVILKGLRSSGYKQFIHNCFDVCRRQALHAGTLGFVHPATGKEMFFDSEIPDDMQQLIERWKTYVNGSRNPLLTI
ncbi:MAG: RluA family pseudouridine synthase [Tannerella sp.]|jgi:23S rRNA pseudouridine1911/1915/1917 synthase|nr:RluA family pseudouridine synthase [Tannerella sp.]